MKIRKILIVDDEQIILSYLEKKFTKLDYSVYLAGDGEEAVKQAFLNNPDIILLDIKLPKLNGIEFVNLDYKDVLIPANSIVYCDIPYEKTKQYSTSKGFNHLEFWDYARKLSTEGYSVFISEYNAPSDFKCIWSKNAKSSLSANGQIGGNKVSTERLFLYCP